MKIMWPYSNGSDNVVTMNKDTKIVGGTTKYSQKSQAVQCFYLTAECCTRFLCPLRAMHEMNIEVLHHSELQKHCILKDDKCTSTVVDILEEWGNPFKEDQ